MSDDALVIASSYDKLNTALNKLRFNDEFKVDLSSDSLEASAGQYLIANVFVPAPEPGGQQYESVFGIAALYDAGGRMVTYEIIASNTTEAPVSFSVSLPIPEDTAGLTYKLSLWNAETMVPLINSISLES